MGSIYKKINKAKQTETINISCVPEYPNNFRYNYGMYSGLKQLTDNKINDIVNNKIENPPEKVGLIY